MIVSPFINRVLDFCYPGRCACCESAYDRAAILCRECERDLENLAAAPACEFCAMPLVEHGAPCPYCQGRGLSPFERIVRIGVYQDPLRSLIHRAKYSDESYLAEQLADRLAERDEAKTLLEHADVLVPVPLHFRRQLQRGYNQAEVIARRIGAVRRVKVAQAAARCRATESQISLHSRASRVENLKDAFALLRPVAVAGKHIVLVDDVMTSGATLLSLARVLKPAKPASLSALVIAIADPRGHAFETI